MLRRVLLSAVLLASGCATIHPRDSHAADFALTQHEHGVTVNIGDELFTEYVIDQGPKPFCWPIIGPTGKRMTRAFPMELRVPGERKDHPHHRSLWFTHGNVNDVDFWAEGRGRGKIEHREFVRVESGPRGHLVTRNAWVDADGKQHLADERELVFQLADDQSRIIDFNISLTAVGQPAKFGDTKEGSFGIRIPTVLDVDSRKGGQIVNSEGLFDAAAWGKPAAWVDYHGPLEGRTVGIAILNHPTSFRFPTHWHVRTYGLFAANPFGLHDFPGGESLDGSHTLAVGESMRLRYRVIFHCGDQQEAKLAEAYSAYAAEP